MDKPNDPELRRLLRLLLAQRLEINALESVLTRAGVLTEAHLHEIRTQAAGTAKAWSSEESDDVLTLLQVHSLPTASMRVPPPETSAGEGG
jgi:hypothetical protein